MNFKELMKSLEQIDKINKELEQLKDPAYVERRTAEVFAGADYSEAIDKIMAVANEIVAR